MPRRNPKRDNPRTAGAELVFSTQRERLVAKREPEVSDDRRPSFSLALKPVGLDEFDKALVASASAATIGCRILPHNISLITAELALPLVEEDARSLYDYEYYWDHTPRQDDMERFRREAVSRHIRTSRSRLAELGRGMVYGPSVPHFRCNTVRTGNGIKATQVSLDLSKGVNASELHIQMAELRNKGLSTTSRRRPTVTPEYTVDLALLNAPYAQAREFLEAQPALKLPLTFTFETPTIEPALVD